MPAFVCCRLDLPGIISPLAQNPYAIRLQKSAVWHLPASSSRNRGVINAQYHPRMPGEGLLDRNRAKLRLFLDTADERLWEQWLPTGAFYGVTTNPLLLEKAGLECSVRRLTELANEAFSLGAEEVQLQAWGGSTDELIRTGLELAYIDPRVVVKIPLTQEGSEAASLLVKRGIRVTMTGIYNAHQVILAASIGADYAAPYLGRIIAQGRNGVAEVIDMMEIVEGMESDLRVLVASIKSIQQVTSLAVEGITTFALPPDVVADMFFTEATVEAALDFERAAKSMGSDKLVHDEGIKHSHPHSGEEGTLAEVAADGTI